MFLWTVTYIKRDLVPIRIVLGNRINIDDSAKKVYSITNFKVPNLEPVEKIPL